MPVFYCHTDFPITRYRFFCTGGGSTRVDKFLSAHFTEYAVPESRFRSGVHYSCSVIAENNIGQSGQSDPFLLRSEYTVEIRYFFTTLCIEPSRSPGTPTAVTTPRSALVTWTVSF